MFFKKKFKDMSDEEYEEKRRELQEMDFDRKDILAMFLAGVITFLPPILLIYLVIWLIIKFLT
ncbi:MAG: hypothetical protein GX219_01175 [Tissierellia bacterium]|nr:hypothetical protein [Tissierellia bacterium]